MDKKDVYVIYTFHTAAMEGTGRNDRVTGEAVVKPKVINDYNKLMGGVDRSDQLGQCFGFVRKTLKAYKIYFHLQNSCEV